MRTREESLNNFCDILDKLINSKYLFASSDIFNAIKTINSSKLLTDIFNHFSLDYDFESALTSALIDDGETKGFVLPTSSPDIIAFTYLLLRAINYKHAQLTDFLDYFDGGKNYDVAYKNFANKVLTPFKNCVYEVGVAILNSTQSESENEFAKSKVVEEPITVDLENVKRQEEKVKKQQFEDVDGTNNITLLRLLDLDNLAINQSKLRSEDKDELIYVLNIFAESIRANDDEKIKLAYLAYYYAMRPYTKIKSNLKSITHILIEKEII